MSNYSYDFIKIIEVLKPKIRQKIDSLKKNFEDLKVSKKADNTIVTEFDLFISDLIKQEFLTQYPELNFYSEEDLGRFEFPLIILDPIDGTREFALGMDECAISFGVYFSNDLLDPRNFSWIYNPITEFEISSFDKVQDISKMKKELLSYVSRSEFEKGLHQSVNGIKFEPKGSIAFKLALLAKGYCDFVITKKDKKVWDIAAGTHICALNGIFMYEQGVKNLLIKQDKYTCEIVWGHKSILSNLDFNLEKD